MIASAGSDVVDRDHTVDLIDVLGDLIPRHPRIGHWGARLGVRRIRPTPCCPGYVGQNTGRLRPLTER